MNLRRTSGVVAVVSVLLLTMSPLLGAVSWSADAPTPIVDASPLTQVTDGQAVTITVRTTDASISASEAQARLCRGGITYQPSTDLRPNADSEVNGPNCPGQPISSSSDASTVDRGINASAATAGGESFLFRVGNGVAAWTDNDGNSQNLTCDETHSCVLLVEVRYSPGKDASGAPLRQVWKPYAFPIGYASADPLKACGTPRVDPVGTGGADFMQDAWIAMSLGFCAANGANGAPTRASFVGEGTAVTQYSNGALDLAYTAGGYNKDMATGSTPQSGLITSDTPHRPSVAIPVALDAAVLGVAGGQIVESHKVPYKELQVKASEIAQLIGQGGLTPDARQALLQRDAPGNKQMSQTGIFDTAVKLGLATYHPELVQGAILDRAEVDRQIELYRSRGTEARRVIVGLQPKRAEVILAGACIVRTVMDKLGHQTLTVSDRGLRHGLLIDRFGT